MPTADEKKIINSNDNHSASWVTTEPWEMNAVLARNIPLANWLIEKHGDQWWKNHPETPDYQRVQHGICCQLHYLVGTREETLIFIAAHLEIPPLRLLNDSSKQIKAIPDAHFAGDGTPPKISYRD